MFSFGSIAQNTTQAALAGVGASHNLGVLSKSEAQAQAIGRIAEINIIKPDDKKSGSNLAGKLMNKVSDDRNRIMSNLSLQKKTYNSFGELGVSIAMRRAGAAVPPFSISAKV